MKLMVSMWEASAGFVGHSGEEPESLRDDGKISFIRISDIFTFLIRLQSQSKNYHTRKSSSYFLPRNQASLSGAGGSDTETNRDPGGISRAEVCFGVRASGSAC